MEGYLMNESKFYNDPTNRIVTIFDNRLNAVEAKSGLIEFGFDEDDVRIFFDESASDVDASAKWFADTDEDMKKFKRELQSGRTILSIRIKDCDCREEVHKILKTKKARRVTHFGAWVTEVLS